MLKLSKKTDYAIILLFHLGDVRYPSSAKEMAENYKLPQPMVANILKQLVEKGLIYSVRGQLGGYVLAKSADNITLYDIINVTDNPFNLVECAHDEELCKVHECCPTRQPLVALHQSIQMFLEQTTLSSIMKESYFKNQKVSKRHYETSNLS
jgi:Rrf2 family protein